MDSSPKSRTSRLRKRLHKHRQKSAYKMVAAEISIKLVVNLLLSITAVAALTRLLPYQHLQLSKLHSIGVEREEVEKRVEHLREDFSRNFDPNQTQKIMQEQSPRVDPNQRRIFWVENK